MCDLIKIDGACGADLPISAADEKFLTIAYFLDIFNEILTLFSSEKFGHYYYRNYDNLKNLIEI